MIMKGLKLPRLTLPQIVELLKETYREWSSDQAPQLGAALAFYTIFSLAPLLVIIVAIVGVVLGRETVQVHLLQELTELVGKNNATTIMSTVKGYYDPGSGLRATLMAFFLMLLGSTKVFMMLKNALNTMWDVEAAPVSGIKKMIKDRFVSFGVVLGSGFLLLVFLVASSVLAAASQYMGHVFPVIFQIADFVLSIIIITLLFAMLYKFLPDVEITWDDVWVGAAITALLLTLGKILLNVYLTRSTVSSAYGAAGSLVVFLLWVYYSAQIVFVGAEFTQVYARKYGTAIEPKESAAGPHPDARRE